MAVVEQSAAEFGCVTVPFPPTLVDPIEASSPAESAYQQIQSDDTGGGDATPMMEAEGTERPTTLRRGRRGASRRQH